MVLFLQNNEVDTLRKLTKKIEVQKKFVFIFEILCYIIVMNRDSLVKCSTAYSFSDIDNEFKNRIFVSLETSFLLKNLFFCSHQKEFFFQL